MMMRVVGSALLPTASFVVRPIPLSQNKLRTSLSIHRAGNKAPMYSSCVRRPSMQTEAQARP